MIGSRKTKSTGPLDILAGLYKKIGALETQTAGRQSSADSKEINLEAIRQGEKARVRMDVWKAEQYVRLCAHEEIRNPIAESAVRWPYLWSARSLVNGAELRTSSPRRSRVQILPDLNPNIRTSSSMTLTGLVWSEIVLCIA